MIRVQTEDFDLNAQVAALSNPDQQSGAVVAFVGLVRDFTEGNDPAATMTLEHYPGMTENQLADIEKDARARWDLNDVTIIHRVGTLSAGEQIVLVLASSRHRQNAFDAANFIMDILKTKATFWKKESAEDQAQWVDARDSDQSAADRWGA